jgi:hypothetical protein
MNNSDILMYESCKMNVNLSYQCKAEYGIEEDEIFTIIKVIGNFEQIEVRNQYNQVFTINPNQLKK